jgi:hypothetical protein
MITRSFVSCFAILFVGAGACQAQMITGTVVDLEGNARRSANVTINVSGSVVLGPLQPSVLDIAALGGRPLFDRGTGTFRIPINPAALSRGDNTVRLDFSGTQGAVILEETRIDKLDGTKNHDIQVVVPKKRFSTYCAPRGRRLFHRR